MSSFSLFVLNVLVAPGQKRRQNGPMICVWTHGHQLSIEFFNAPLHISQLEFIIETKVCAYTEIVCL